MKKLFLLLALPVLFIACGDKGLDRSLDGTWVGEVETSDLDLISAVGQNAVNSKALKETLIFKIDGKHVSSYRSKNYQTMDNRVEVEIGTYHKSGDVMNFDIEQHSCVKTDPTRPLSKRIVYNFSGDFKTLTMTFGPNKSISFRRLDQVEEKSMNQILNTATTGCFSGNNGFNQEKIGKPESSEVSSNVDQIEDQTNQELDSKDTQSLEENLKVSEQ